MLSPDNILQISKAEVSTHELYAGPLAPVASGPLDLRMGVGTKLLRCGTCGEGLEGCVGHFGHARLSVPIYHIGYFKHLLLILKMVCKYCYHVLLPREELEGGLVRMRRVEHNYIARVALFRKIFKEASKNLKCPHCERRNPVVQKLPKVCGKIEVRHSVL